MFKVGDWAIPKHSLEFGGTRCIVLVQGKPDISGWMPCTEFQTSIINTAVGQRHAINSTIYKEGDLIPVEAKAVNSKAA